jgi:hypothetical protein
VKACTHTRTTPLPPPPRLPLFLSLRRYLSLCDGFFTDATSLVSPPLPPSCYLPSLSPPPPSPERDPPLPPRLHPCVCPFHSISARALSLLSRFSLSLLSLSHTHTPHTHTTDHSASASVAEGSWKKLHDKVCLCRLPRPPLPSPPLSLSLSLSHSLTLSLARSLPRYPPPRPPPICTFPFRLSCPSCPPIRAISLVSCHPFSPPALPLPPPLAHRSDTFLHYLCALFFSNAWQVLTKAEQVLWSVPPPHHDPNAVLYF